MPVHGLPASWQTGVAPSGALAWFLSVAAHLCGEQDPAGCPERSARAGPCCHEGVKEASKHQSKLELQQHDHQSSTPPETS